MSTATALGQYLRARRELVRPEAVGLRGSGRRRVPGLRREELATLAGISADYYLRLEQGRDCNPSSQVIAALARALQLDEDATSHLHALSRPALPRQRVAPDAVPASIEALIASWTTTPAFVHNRYMDILAANALSIAVTPMFRPGANALRAVYLDPELRRLYESWDDLALRSVARVRTLVSPNLDDPRLLALVDELSAKSKDFRRLWARHDYHLAPASSQVFNHPIVGRMELQPERLSIVGRDGLMLIVKHARPDSPSAQALARLAEIVAAESRARR